MFIVNINELRRQKEEYNVEFQRRMEVFERGVGTKPHRVKHPGQLYACSCPTMRTWRMDITSSTCKDCIANEATIPVCRICKCNCQTGIFTEKEIQPMAVSKAMKDDLQARQLAPDVQQRAFNNLGNILSNSIRDGVKSINSTKLVMNVTNVMSAAAGFASRMQMNSEEELHALQQCVPITTRLHASGTDVQQVLSHHPWKKGKRHIQNGLSVIDLAMEEEDSDGDDDCKMPANKDSPKRKQNYPATLETSRRQLSRARLIRVKRPLVCRRRFLLG